MFCALLGPAAFAAEVEYIAPETQKQLEQLFDQSGFSIAKDETNLKNGHWSCDMYGVRSRMQVQHGLKLYQWNKAWHNAGAQLVSDYKIENAALIGTHERFEDQVKLTKDGRLISRLSVTTPLKMVVAYSVCKNL